MKKIKEMQYLEGIAIEVREEKNKLENKGRIGNHTTAAFVLCEDGKTLYAKPGVFFEFSEIRDKSFKALNELLSEFKESFGSYDKGVSFFQETFAPFFEMDVEKAKIEHVKEDQLGKDFRCFCQDTSFDFHVSTLSKDFIVTTEKEGITFTYQLVESPSNAYLKTISLCEKIHA